MMVGTLPSKPGGSSQSRKSYDQHRAVIVRVFRAKLGKAIYQAVQSYSPQRSSYIFSSLSEGDDWLMRYGGGRLDEMEMLPAQINREHTPII